MSGHFFSFRGRGGDVVEGESTVVSTQMSLRGPRKGSGNLRFT